MRENISKEITGLLEKDNKDSNSNLNNRANIDDLNDLDDSLEEKKGDIKSTQ